MDNNTSKIPGTNNEACWHVELWGHKVKHVAHNYTSTCLAYVGTFEKHMTARRKVTKSTNYIRDKWNLCRWLTGTVRVTVVEWNFFADAVLDLLHRRLWIFWYWIMWKKTRRNTFHILLLRSIRCACIYTNMCMQCRACTTREAKNSPSAKCFPECQKSGTRRSHSSPSVTLGEE
jgi:hypothetical protein